MNNEETIVKQPQNENSKKEQAQSVAAPKKSNRGKKIAATVGTVVAGGAVGSGATIATSEMLNDQEDEAQDPEENVPVIEEAAATDEELPQKDIEVDVYDPASDEIDYTGHNNDDYVTPDLQTTSEETDSNYSDEVQVLGVYDAQDEYGQPIQVAGLTDGEEVVAGRDVDYDGVADTVVGDENHNGVIEENEVHDISECGVYMADFQQNYLEQQEQMQQEQDDSIYYASDDMQDYQNDIDPTFA